MGLDFSTVSTRARLAEGSYLAVQIPEADQASWDWGLWKYNPISGAVVGANDHKHILRYNYVVFGVSKMDGDAGQSQTNGSWARHNSIHLAS